MKFFTNHSVLNQHEQAEEFLSIASWCIIKNANCPAHVRAELHQHFGLLYVARNSMDKAVENLATCVYYLALMHGTEHLITSYGYFNLGNVFATQGKMDRAADYLRKVTDIWYRHLISAISKETASEREPTPVHSNANTQRTSKTSFSHLTNVTSDAATVYSDMPSENTSLDALGNCNFILSAFLTKL